MIQLKSRKTRQSERFRDHIRQVLENRGNLGDDEWWEDEKAQEELERLAREPGDSATDSGTLKIESQEKLIIGVYRKDKKALLEQMAKLAGAAAGEPDAEGIHLLFFVRGMRDRFLLERYYQRSARDQILAAVKGRGPGGNLGLQCTYVLDGEDKKQTVKLTGLKRYEMIRMPYICGRINMEAPGRAEGADAKEEALHGLVFTADLIQLVEIYSTVGDRLFEENVRFGINDMLGVDRAICRTLEEEPGHFWYKNNGITILSKRQELNQKSAETLVLDELEPEGELAFSVINGAQTITAAAGYFFSREFLIEESRDAREREELKKKLEDSKQAQVLVRVICIPEEENVPSESLAKEISVALNQQKPVKVEDIAFTTKFVGKLADYLGRGGDRGAFCLARRGEGGLQSRQMELTLFARARKACAGEPGDARSKSANELLKFQIDQSGNYSFSQKDIFVDEWMEADQDREAEVFGRYYGAVWFAKQLAERYDKIKREIRRELEKEDPAVWIAAGNGKWYFTAALIQLLNGFSFDWDAKGVRIPDYSGFHCTLEEVSGRLPEAVMRFAGITALYAGLHKDECGEVDSNLFKKSDCYQGVIRELERVCRKMEGDREGNVRLEEDGGLLLTERLEKFAALFPEFLPRTGSQPEAAASFGEGPESENGPKTAGRSVHASKSFLILGGRRIFAESLAEAMEKTAEYILLRYPNVRGRLKNSGIRWLTADIGVVGKKEGYFRSVPRRIVVDKTPYWVGTHSNTQMKLRQLGQLCELAEVKKGEIAWYTGTSSEPLFSW